MQMPFKFHGGVHPNYMKAPDVPVTVIAPPPQVVLPMMQHIGAPLVAVGDYVKMGQKIADNPAPVSAPIHATVSGKVIAIEPRPHPLGDMIPAIVIENDFQDTPCTDLAPLTPEQMKDPEAILERIREAGIVGQDPRRPWQGRYPHHQRRRVRAVPQRRPPDHEEPP
jgi:electron transport complex protein RnfC